MVGCGSREASGFQPSAPLTKSQRHRRAPLMADQNPTVSHPHATQGPKAKQSKVSKRTRFEVFKRDRFTCQYCGAKAPDVVLHVDHIDPISRGGSRDIVNLITACVGCNAGKSNVPLSDATAIKKQQKQLEVLAERREQLQMLVEWRDGMASIEDEKVELLVDRVNDRLKVFPGRLNATGEAMVKTWLVKFGLECTLHGIAQAFESSNAEALLTQMAQFSAAARKVEREPELREYWSIRALLRARCFRYGPEWAPVEAMRKSFRAGFAIADLRSAASSASDYDEFLSLIGY